MKNQDLKWSIAAVGDALVATRIAQYNDPLDPMFSKMVTIIKEADVGFLNLENPLFRFSEFSGWPQVEHGGYWQVGPPEAAGDLKKIGFTMFNCANNHTTDYGIEGMQKTNDFLDKLEIIHSGTGMNLGFASRPGYFDSVKGRFALIGFATSFTTMSRAGDSRKDMVGRPGLNALRLERNIEADYSTFNALRSAYLKYTGKNVEDHSEFELHNMEVKLGLETRIVEKVNTRDEERILHEVRNASKLADYVIVNSHSHEPSNESTEPPSWLIDFAKKSLDAGASAFFVHGPHQLRGIEVYKDKPIFYSLGNFIFHEELYDPLPADLYEIFDLPDNALQSDLEDTRFKGGTIGFPSNHLWYESVIAVPTFLEKKMIDLKLYPIDLGQDKPRSQRGVPRLANDEKGRSIIERLALLSNPFGTSIQYKDGIGVWVSN
jgi:poly-gamma-glutamate capsule biosynthesis protein CapA/YwtB (metallophosphatase superfamily)